jgi:hypothetical protein
VLRRNDTTVSNWSRNERRSFPITSSVALRIFSLVSSTAAVERSFKIQGTIHTKLRNRLTAKVCQKLTLYDRNYSNQSRLIQRIIEMSKSPNMQIESFTWILTIRKRERALINQNSSCLRFRPPARHTPNNLPTGCRFF